MRILFFSSIFPRPWQPTHGIFCWRLCKAFQEAGHPIRILSPRSWLEGWTGPGEVRALTDMGEMQAEYPVYFYTPRVLRWAYDRFMRASVGTKLGRAIAEFSPDCIISYWVHPDGAVAVRAARAAGIPSAVIVGGSDVLIQPREDPRRGRRILAALQAASAVVTVSRHLRDRVIDMGVAAEKIHTVYQGVDETLFFRGDRSEARQRLGLPDTARIFICVGRLVPVKGMEVLLNACSLLRTRGLEFHLYLLGDGPCRTALQTQTHTLQLSDHVSFMGSILPEKLPDWYRAADLTLLTSHSEGLPNVLRESLACGTPFIATDVGGIREIATAGWSVLVPPADPQALAHALQTWFASPAAVRPPLRIETWAESAQAFLRVMQPLVTASPGRGTPIAPAAMTAWPAHL